MSTVRTEGADGGSGRAMRSRAAALALRVLERLGLAVLLVAVIVWFSVRLPDSFPTAVNFRNIVANQSVLAILSVAAIVPLTAGQFDLSIGAVLGLASIATAAALSHFGLPLGLAVVVGVGIGALVGLLNGVLVAKVGVNALIATLGVAATITGLVSWYTEGLSILTGIPDTLVALGSGTWLALPRPLYVVVAVSVLAWYLLEHTPFGRHLHAVGTNPSAARLVGLNVDRLVVLSFVVAGSLTGLAGVLQVARQGGGNPQVGAFFMMPALSAAFLGATAIHPGRFNVPGTLLAVFFLAVSVSGLSLSGVENWVESIFNGVSLVTAISISTFIGRRRAGA